MSDAAIAITAIVVSGVQVMGIIGAGAWLIHHKRILFAASPKPAAQQAGEPKGRPGAGQQADGEVPRTSAGTPSTGEAS